VAAADAEALAAALAAGGLAATRVEAGLVVDAQPRAVGEGALAGRGALTRLPPARGPPRGRAVFAAPPVAPTPSPPPPPPRRRPRGGWAAPAGGGALWSTAAPSAGAGAGWAGGCAGPRPAPAEGAGLEQLFFELTEVPA